MRNRQPVKRQASERASGIQANGELAYVQVVAWRAGGSKTAGQSVGRAGERPDGETGERAHSAGKLDDGCVLQARREAGASVGDGHF